MLNSTSSDVSDGLRMRRKDGGSKDENDDVLSDGIVTETPCHESSEGSSTNITESFSLEPNSSFSTFVFDDHGSYHRPYSCWNWLQRKVPALDHLRANWKPLVLGQMISFCLATSGAAQATLNLDCHLSAPVFVVSLYYFLLSWHIVFLWKRRYEIVDTLCDAKDGSVASSWSRCKRSGHQPLDTDDRSSDMDVKEDRDDEADSVYAENQVEAPVQHQEPTKESPFAHSFFGLFPMRKAMWRYCILALIDVEANAITALSFRYTTLTSIALLDNLSIPTAMLLSRCLFARRYTWVHVIGVLICMVGVALNMVQDYDDDKNIEEQEEYPFKLQGDLCAITGGILYGVSNVMVEVTLRDSSDSEEYLGMMGFFAFVLATIQAWIFEADEILEFFGSHLEFEGKTATCHSERWWVLAFYVGSTAFVYVGASRFFQISEATFFALSLLTGDLWSVIFSVFFEHIVPHVLFFVALVFVLSGMIMYEMAPSPVLEDREVIIDDNSDELDKPAPSRGNIPGEYVDTAVKDEEDRYSISDARLT